MVSGLFAKPLVSPSHTKVTRESFENQSSFGFYFITMEIPHFMHRLDPVNTEESIKPLLKQIRPEWDLEKVKFKEFTEG